MSRKKILVVEDDAVLRRLFKSLLESEGYRVVAVENKAETVLGILDAEKDGFGIVLLDIYVPRLGWRHILKTINMISTRVPVVTTTGFMMTCGREIEEQVTAHGAACCLTEPMGVRGLLQVVRRFCDL